MMEDIKHGKINCVIVKDLSRLGRNYVETSNYIERVFPFFHVRFLAVTDDFDSFREGVDLTVPLKNIINEFYSKDLAKKSSSAKKALWKEGKFTGAWEPYGYRKSEQDRHQLVVDEEAAGHLREIFTMYMDGCSYSDIAKRLNTDGILSPTLQREYYKTGEKPSPESKPWNNYEVKRVLQDVHCTGDSVYGKYQQSVFQGNKQRNLPESEWLYAENTHEGIIDKELFRQVQEKIREFTEAYKKKHQLNNGAIRNHNFYTGKIRCGGCGNRMVLSREKTGTFYYICGADANHKSGGNQCKGHRVKKEYVDEDVLRLIQSHMKAVLDTEKLIREMNSASRNQTQYLLLDKEVGKLRRELSRISKRKSDLYEDYSERLITEEEYMQFSRIYSNEIENIKNRLDVVLAAQVRYSKDYHIEEGWGKVIHTYMSKRKLTKEMADAFVDSIIIHGKYDYEIKLVYDDQFADLQKLKKEKEAQSR
ncbi:recombinase family protein [Dorea formicigenerans]|nr:recombinase family protein [Dorea formicigenerans]MCG4712205.1 recombinase family protein [Dorea formicigenerans]